MEVNVLTHAQQAINTARQQTSRVILFYSGGKDSLVLLDLLSPIFDEVVCVFMYFVKDLAHINKYLVHAERNYSNTQVLQVPHFVLSTIHKEGIYCTPNPNITIKKVRDIDAAEIDEGESYVTLSFDDYKSKAAFTERFGLGADDIFIKGEIFSNMIERVK